MQHHPSVARDLNGGHPGALGLALSEAQGIIFSGKQPFDIFSTCGINVGSM
jgi:hypothetical protein